MRIAQGWRRNNAGVKKPHHKKYRTDADSFGEIKANFTILRTVIACLRRSQGAQVVKIFTLCELSTALSALLVNNLHRYCVV